MASRPNRRKVVVPVPGRLGQSPSSRQLPCDEMLPGLSKEMMRFGQWPPIRQTSPACLISSARFVDPPQLAKTGESDSLGNQDRMPGQPGTAREPCRTKSAMKRWLFERWTWAGVLDSPRPSGWRSARARNAPPAHPLRPRSAMSYTEVPGRGREAGQDPQRPRSTPMARTSAK